MLDSSFCVLYYSSERNQRSPTCQKREENKFGEYVCVRTRQSEHRKASSDYFTLAPVNQLDEVVSQSMIP